MPKLESVMKVLLFLAIGFVAGASYTEQLWRDDIHNLDSCCRCGVSNGVTLQSGTPRRHP